MTLLAGRVVKRTFVPDDSARWLSLLARYEGKRVQLDLARETRPRTLSQNAYLWRVVYGAIEDWSGQDSHDIHRFFKEKFLPRRRIQLPSGDCIEVVGSTRGLDVGEFSNFIEKVKAHAAQEWELTIL